MLWKNDYLSGKLVPGRVSGSGLELFSKDIYILLKGLYICGSKSCP